MTGQPLPLQRVGLVRCDYASVLELYNVQLPEQVEDDRVGWFVDLRSRPREFVKKRAAYARKQRYMDELLALQRLSEVQDWLQCLRPPSGTSSPTSRAHTLRGARPCAGTL